MTAGKTILILEDDSRLAKSLQRDFEDRGYEVTLAARLAELPDRPFDFAVVDLRLGVDSGLNGISFLKKRSASCRIVLLSGYGSISTAVEAVKRGACDCLLKPAGFELIEAALLGRPKPEGDFKPPSLEKMEHEYIHFVLGKNEGNISKTAKDLGLHRQSLQRKLRKFTSGDS